MSSYRVQGQLMFDYTIHRRNNESLTHLAHKEEDPVGESSRAFRNNISTLPTQVSGGLAHLAGGSAEVKRLRSTVVPSDVDVRDRPLLDLFGFEDWFAERRCG